jgi:hypothetical protein
MNHCHLEKSLYYSAMDNNSRYLAKRTFMISHPMNFFQSIRETLPKRMQV